MAHTLNIRRGRPNDARSYSIMSRALIENGLPPTWDSGRLSRLLSQSDTNAYSLLSGRQLAGFSISKFGSRRMHLVLHAISPEFRRRGMGRQLLNWQIEAALAGGLTECTLEVRANNTAARMFYESCEFRVTRRLPGYYSHREDALRMTRSPLYSASR
jgi:ribosomal protein S18 acetylase RimI-like enzyme